MSKKQTEKFPPKNEEIPVKERIIAAFKKHLLTKGENPPSVYVFAEELGISEAEFYTNFSSFESLHKEIWNDFLKSTVSALRANEEYAEYSVREKMLSFYYTLVEVLKSNRSFVLLSHSKMEGVELIPSSLKTSRKTYIDYINGLVEEGLQSGEFKKRPYLSEKYAEALWLQFLFLLRFWVKDESRNFEQTDALIEKTVKLTFELLGESPLDSFIDLAKFLYQNK